MSVMALNSAVAAAAKSVTSEAPQTAPAVLPAVDAPPREDQLDAELVARAQQGDRRAFDVLVRKYQYKIVQLVERLVGEADGLDVAQESFIKAYRALAGFRGQSAFYTWLYRIAINTSKNFLVARKRRPAAQDIDVADAELFGHTGQMSDVDTPEALALSSEIRDKVTDAIHRLPSDLRQAITLRELEGLSYEEIAEAMDCPIGTVRSRIFRARAAIDEVLQPLLK
jgi:RNA polymerase sigma-70 factor, ECF subfamily